MAGIYAGSPVDGYVVNPLRKQLRRAVLRLKHDGGVCVGVKPAEEAGKATAAAIVRNLLKDSFSDSGSSDHNPERSYCCRIFVYRGIFQQATEETRVKQIVYPNHKSTEL